MKISRITSSKSMYNYDKLIVNMNDELANAIHFHSNYSLYYLKSFV